MQFAKWLDTFIDEKGIDREHVMTVKGSGEWGDNLMPVQVLIDALKEASPSDQEQVKSALVRIDFNNGKVLPFFEHIAQAIAL